MRKNLLDILIIIGIFAGFYFLFIYLGPKEAVQKWTFHTTPFAKEDTPVVDKEVQSQKDTTTYNDAITKKDPTLCESISDLSERSRCKDNITISVAVETHDRSNCSSLSGAMLVRCEDTVIYSLASRDADKSLCREISDENIQTNCLKEQEEIMLKKASGSGQISREFCTLFETEWKTQCESLVSRVDESSLYRDAIEKKDITLCDTITDESLRFQCRDILLLQSAIASSDSTLCDGIRDATRQETCSLQVRARSDIVLLQRFALSGTLDDCATLSTESYKNQCHDMVLLRTIRTSGDTDRCRELYSTGMIDRCEKTGGK